MTDLTDLSFFDAWAVKPLPAAVDFLQSFGRFTIEFPTPHEEGDYVEWIILDPTRLNEWHRYMDLSSRFLRKLLCPIGENAIS